MKCNHQTSSGPCSKPVKSGSAKCAIHSDNGALNRSYRISNPELQDAVAFHAKASLLDISQQIVTLKAMIERRLNMAGDTPVEQIAAYNFVAAQLPVLAKLTETMVKLSRESGELMERNEVVEYTQRIVGIVAEELASVPGAEGIIDKIVSRLENEG